jgi:outer membrane protein
MKKLMKRTGILFVVCLVVFGLIVPAGFCKDLKVAYVDLRKAFYEYEKTKSLEEELNSLTQESQNKRNVMIEEITKLRDQAELLSGEKLEEKQKELDEKLTELQNYDREMRQTLLNKKNDMFRQVIDDIQKIVEGIGEKESYDYVLDSRNIMFADEQYDLTDRVITELNKE